MLSSKRLSLYLMLILSLALSLTLTGIHFAAAYPGPPEIGGGPSDSGGWTGEATVGLSGASSAQMAYTSDGYIYMAASNGSNVYAYRSNNVNNLSFDYLGMLDWYSGNTAVDPYIAAYGQHVVVSWKELTDGRWAHCFAFSYNWGNTWFKYRDLGASWNNYEAHVTYAGDKIHAAYVSDVSGRNEVYYKRFSLDRVLEDVTCVSDQADGLAATQPCIEASSTSWINIYYVYGNGPYHPIYESYTTNGGEEPAEWNRVEIIPTGGGTDFSYPECAVFWEGGDRRKMVVADGVTGDGYHHLYQNRYYNGVWYGKMLLRDLGTEQSYPQIASRDNDLLIVFRGSGGTTGNEGHGLINLNSGEGTFDFIDGLYYENMPVAAPSSMGCVSDGSTFYSLSCGSSPHNELMIKREDFQPPSVAIDPLNQYYKGNITVSANAYDDFRYSGGWLLHPYSEPYDEGIMHANFYYSANGGGWTAFNSGEVDWQAPWGKTLYVDSLPDGVYDFRVVVMDTSDKYKDNVYADVILDRLPPTDVDMQISGLDGDNGWYKSQPSLGPTITATDPNMPNASGIKNIYYKFDVAADWTVYSEPFALLEGQHDIHYYAGDNAGNTSGIGTFSYKADFTDPQGEITFPEPERYFQTKMEVEATCQDDLSGVESITWLVDGNPKKTDANPKTDLDLSDLVDGQHSLEAEIKDAAGRTSRTEAVIFYKDVTPPTVEVIEPTGEKWVRGMVTIKADIKDNLKVGQAEFCIDGKMIDRRTSAPWMATWDTSTAKNGYHAVQVKAWDAAGNQAEVTALGEMTVYVGNNISETNHFAEGCTRAGFDTWLCLQNPGNEHADVTVNYYLGEGQGAASTRTYSLPPHSRSTIYVNADVGADKDVSIQVTSSKPIVSERPMYFDYQGTAAHHWQGGHTAQGAHFPREEWCFAEGCTRNGFETWLCLQNPEGREAQVKVEYMMENGATLDRNYRVAPWSRGTILVNQEVGEGHDVSMRVVSNSPIVAERPVYFLYQDMWDGGHNVMGAAQPEKEWYFAEGCTRTGFNQWICLMNPNQEAATARIIYVMEDGGRIEREYVLAPRSRFTVNVNNDVARQHDVSSCIISDLPIVVERPMYFLYNSMIDEGSNAMGVCRPGSSWYLAEGCTRAGFEEWICLMNPGEETAEVILRFMLEDSSEREHVVNVPPNTRVTVKVNDIVGPDHDVSTEVMSDQPVIVERPMYSMYRGSCPSGDTLSGYTFNP